MGFDLNSLVRDNIRTLVPYSSARGEYRGSDGIFLDANENAFGSPLATPYNRYPDPRQRRLKELIAMNSSIRKENIFIGNGSDEAIDLLIRIFCRPGIDNVVVCPPTYGMYEVAAGISDIAVKRVVLTSEFQLDVAAMAGELDENTRIIFLCSPNNPTGNLLERRSILEVLGSFNGIVVVDEAYIHYANERSLVRLLADHPNLVVLQTFSKAWGLAGLRVGVAFGSEQIINLLSRVKLPYNISAAAQLMVAEALGNRRQVEGFIEQTIRERERVARRLIDFRHVAKIYPSDANFLLVRVSNASELYTILLGERIVVRNRNNVVLCDGCLRITIGDPAENDALLLAFEKYEKSFVY